MTSQSSQSSKPAPPLDLIWGAAAIGQEIGVPRRTAYWMLQNNLLPAVKVGAKWAADRDQLRGCFVTKEKGDSE